MTSRAIRWTACALTLAAGSAGSLAQVPSTVHETSLTQYLPSAASTGQDLAPLVDQRGVFFDGTTRQGNVQGWITARQQTGESWNGNAFMAGGIQLHTGTYAITDVHLALPAQVPWIVGVSYNGRQHDGSVHNSDGPQGKNWQQLSQPEIIFVDDGDDAEDVVYILFGADRFLEFRRMMNETPDPDEPTDTFTGVNRAAGAVVYAAGGGGEPDTWTYYDPSGKATVFFGGSTASNKADWQIWKITDAAGNVAFVGDATTASTAVTNGYTAEGNIAVAYDSADRRFTYTYATVAGSKVLESVVAETKASGTWASPTGVEEVQRVEYAHYVNADDYGSDRDLKTITITTPLTDVGLDDVKVKYFRYWEAAHNPGGGIYGDPHLIQYIVDYEGTRRLDWEDNATFDASYEGESENDLKPFAMASFEYDSDRRITEAWFNGECGCSGANNGVHTFTYDSNMDTYAGASGYDLEWANRTIVTRPDGTYVTQYFDETGGPLGRLISAGNPASSPGNFWGTAVERDANGYVILIATPAAISGYNHNAASEETPQPEFSVHSSGNGTRLIHTFVRDPSGVDQGYVIRQSEQDGSAGTKYVVRDSTYVSTSRSVGAGAGAHSVSRLFPEKTKVPLAREQSGSYTSTDADIQGTFLTIDEVHASSASLMPKELWSTALEVAAAQNGPENGNVVVEERFARTDGTTAFVMRHDGTNDVYDYMQYTNGQVTKRIHDAQTSHGSDFGGDDPNSVFGITETSSGLRLITTYTYDPQGRTLSVTDPDGHVHRMYYTRLNDGRLVTISIPLVESGTDFYGPASITVTNHAGKVEFSGTLGFSGGFTTEDLEDWIDEDEDDPILALTNGSLTGPAAGLLANVTVYMYNVSGTRLKESRTYFAVPAALPGDSTDNFDPMEYGYDGMGRRWRTKDSPGTITRTVYDALGRVTEQWVGSNDYSFAGGEVSGPDDMTKIAALVYDGGSAGGNSLITTEMVDDDGNWGTTGDQQTTSYLHDLRGRSVVTLNPVAPHSLVLYDNRNRVTASASYSSSGGLTVADAADLATFLSETSNRLNLNRTFFDARGRVWKTQRFEINQSTGAIVQDTSQDVSLVSLMWYDDGDRVIKTLGSSIGKTTYDRLGRAVRAYTLAKINDSTYADADDVSGDHVLSERHTVYEDPSGLVLATATIERFHDDLSTGTTGALDSNADADNLAWTAANITGRISITSMWYDDMHRVVDTVHYGNNGGSTFDRDALAVPARSDVALRTTNTYDEFGRLVQVEDPKGIKSRTVYDSASRTSKTISNYVDGTPGSLTGDDDQTIAYTYTDGLMTAMTADLYDSSDDQTTTYIYGVTKGGSAGDSAITHKSLLYRVQYPDSAGGSDVVTYAYNAQRQNVWMKDQSGNIIETTYDLGGRTTHRRATAIDGDFDGYVARLSTTYTSRGQIETMVSWSSASIGSGSERNGVKYTYDNWGNLTLFEQDNDSAVGGSGSGDLEVEYTYALAHDVTGSKGYRQMRRTGMELPNGDDVTYGYLSSGNLLDDDAGRVTRVSLDATVVASYQYLGMAQVVKTTLDEAGVYSSVTGASGHGFADLDNFGRIETSRWTWDLTTDRDLYATSVAWDRNSWITAIDDDIFTRQSMVYANDNLGRLTSAQRGIDIGGGGEKKNFGHTWTLGQTGNWNISQMDLNGDGDLTDANELDELNPLSGGSAHFNKANELLARDTDTSTSSADNYTLAYDEVGNLIDDGKDYEYVYDAFGRLRKVLNTSNQALVAEYWYNPQGHRITWHFDTTQNGGGAPDGTVDADDPKFHLLYNERWQHVATYRQEDGDPIDSDPKEQFVYHTAGLAGYGSSSYIDSVILRDDHDDVWTDEADATLDRRVYYCQNWRADVVAILAANGRLIERARYEPYGTPHGSTNGDFSGSSDDMDDHYLVPNGLVDIDDQFTYFDLSGATDPMADMTGNSDPGHADYGRPDGTIDASDFFFWIDCFNDADSLGRNVLSEGHTGASLGTFSVRNRKGLAGYQWDPAIRKYHVRNRVLDPDTGRWSRRDPLGYTDHFLSALHYSSGGPLVNIDPFGLEPHDMRIWVQPPPANQNSPYYYGERSGYYKGSPGPKAIGYHFRSIGDTPTLDPTWRDAVSVSDWVRQLEALPPQPPGTNGVLSVHQGPEGAYFGPSKKLKKATGDPRENIADYDFSEYEVEIIRSRNPGGLIIPGCNGSNPSTQEHLQRLANKLNLKISIPPPTWNEDTDETWYYNTGGSIYWIITPDPRPDPFANYPNWFPRTRTDLINLILDAPGWFGGQGCTLFSDQGGRCVL